MDIISYATSLAAKATAGSYISLGILCTVGGFILTGLLFGLKRGGAKTLLRLITVLASAIAAFCIVNAATAELESIFVGRSLEELLIEFVPDYTAQVPENWRNLIACFDAEVAERILFLAVYLVAVPLVFVVLFYLLKLVSSLVYLLLAAILGMMGKRRTFGSAVLGMLVGAVQGALIAAVLLIPVSGFVTLAVELKAPLTDESVPEETVAQVEEFYGWWFDDVTDNPVLSLVGNAGANALFNQMTTAHIADEAVTMGEEAKTLVNVFVDVLPLMGRDLMAPDDVAEEAMRSVLADLGDDKYTAEILAGILRGVSRAIDTGALIIPMEEPLPSLVEEVTVVFSDSSADNLKGDLETLLNVYLILGDHGILTAITEGGEDIIDLLIGEHEGERVITLITDELNRNERTKPISDAMAKMTLNALKGSITVGGVEAEELYDNVKTGLNEVLSAKREDYETEEEYKADVTDKLDTTLKDNGIELEPEIVDTMADYIIENYGDKTEITDQDITDALLSYYDAYAEWLENGGGEIPEDILPEGGEETPNPDGGEGPEGEPTE